MRALGWWLCGLLMATPDVAAQWPPRLNPNIPRTAAGQPNPDAPAPRTAEGKPDFSGVWRGITAPPGRRLAPRPPDPPIAVYREVGQNLPDGLPVTPYGLELLRQRIAGNSTHNPEAHCLPMGLMQLHTQGAPRKFVQTPALLLVLYEAGGETRQIFTDGRPLPPGDPQGRHVGGRRRRPAARAAAGHGAGSGHPVLQCAVTPPALQMVGVERRVGPRSGVGSE